ncbi:MAG: hypothetical protein CL868_14230 [Cytophagaceae bacterium]|nr:hypothetical protein [Cytophagaceae bacterium]|tara:strand:- start:702 stop:896 length:195 start_codon:yes stop_codon:yes gene_type:complete
MRFIKEGLEPNPLKKGIKFAQIPTGTEILFSSGAVQNSGVSSSDSQGTHFLFPKGIKYVLERFA